MYEIKIDVSGLNLESVMECIKFNWKSHTKTRITSLQLLATLSYFIPNEGLQALIETLKYFTLHPLNSSGQPEISIPILQQVWREEPFF